MALFSRIAILLAACGLAFGCTNESSTATGGKSQTHPVIVTTIYPLASVAEQLVGDSAEVVCLLPPGLSPHAFELSPKQMADLSRADLVFAVGLGLDYWIELATKTTTKRNVPFVTLADALGLGMNTTAHDHAHHDHGHDHTETCFTGTDPHIWLDPALMRQALPAITDAMVAALPDHAEAIRQRSGELEAELIALDAAFTEQLAPYAGRSIVTYHAAFNRLAERYGLKVATTLAPVESIGTITPAAVDAAMKAVEKYQLKVLYAEPQFAPDAAKLIADRTGVQWLVLDPIGDPTSPDRNGYLPMMRYNLATLVDGLSRKD